MMLYYGLVLVMLVGGYGVGWAAPGESAPRKRQMGQNQAAEKHYKDGLRHRDAAWVYEEKLSGTRDEKDRAAYAKFIHHTYQRALVEFQKAIEQDSKFYEAYSSLGYVHRKTGDLDAALVAYDRALELNPTYAEAIEYRAEAYFELGRIEEAQKAFPVLASLNKPYAARLLEFAEQWAKEQADKTMRTDVMAWAKEKREALGEVDGWVEKW